MANARRFLSQTKLRCCVQYTADSFFGQIFERRLTTARSCQWYIFFFFFNDTAPTEIYTLSLHDALPISDFRDDQQALHPRPAEYFESGNRRSEEHTSELQSRRDLVCRLLLEKKKKK